MMHSSTSKRFQTPAVLAITIALSFLACSLLLIMYKVDLYTAYAAMLRGAWGTLYNLSDTFSRAAPLLLVALGFSVASCCGMVNIGGEGQMFFGALGATLLAVYMPAGTPPVLSIPLMVIAAMLFGMLWALPAAYMRTKFGVSEIVLTVMMNEVARGIIAYLVSSPMKDPLTPIHQSVMFVNNWRFFQWIPKTKFHVGLLIAVVMVAAVWFLFNKTTLGYQFNAVGGSFKAAKYAGMPVNRLMIASFMVAGALAGLAGAGEAAGIHFRLIESVTGGYGYTAIVVALLGKRNPVFIAVAAFLFASLNMGANAMQRAVGTPSMLASLIQGVVVFFWMISEYMVKSVAKRIDEKKRHARHNEMGL